MLPKDEYTLLFRYLGFLSIEEKFRLDKNLMFNKEL